jgi:S-adenosyl-L-methionine hydrolase (adenosine-forming)
MGIVALLTDFGTTDHFVGSMKAVIVGINPRVKIIDISHDTTPGDISAGAFLLRMCYPDFPKGTVFVAVVDPGVGGKRDAMAVKSGAYFFVGPDNGLLSLASDHAGKPLIRLLDNKKYHATIVSSTFHGRDVFAPAAAHLSNGVTFGKIGSPKKSMVRCSVPPVVSTGDAIIGAVAAVDRFGNCITTIEQDHSVTLRNGAKKLSVRLGTKTIPVGSCYDDVDKGKPVAVWGSAGFLEVSINQGSAERTMKIRMGDRLVMYAARHANYQKPLDFPQ